MKIRILFLTLIACALSVSAQDIITKTDGTTIKAKVTEVGENALKYQRFDNLRGPNYTLPLSSIAKIKYENGAEDSFADKPVILNTQPRVSDVELLRMSSRTTPYDCERKAKIFRRLAWWGGGVIAATGIVVGFYIGNNQWEDATEGLLFIGAPIVGGAAIWCTAFNLAANQQMKKARELELLSSTIIESEVLRFGKTSVNVGLTAMALQQTQTRGLGLGVNINF